jgi:tetratricopeptide (TPR) repeat protein
MRVWNNAAILLLLLLLSRPCQAADPPVTDTLYLELKGTYAIESMGTDIIISALSSGDVLVADGSRSCFWKIHPASHAVDSFTVSGLENRFIYPKAICEDTAGSIWIASPYTHEVIRVAGDGAYVRSFGREELGLERPVDLECAASGAVFILDAENMALIRLLAEKHEVTNIPLSSIPHPDSIKRISIARDNASIFLLNPDQRKLYRLELSGRSSEMPLSSVTGGRYGKLESISPGPSDLLLMTDAQGPSILAYRPDGKVWQRFLLVEHLLQRPTDLALRGNDLWVVDEGKKAVLHLGVKTASTGLEHALLGEEYLAFNFAGEAAGEFEIASTKGYESAEMRLHWGKALYSLTDYSRALAQLERAGDIDPAAPDISLWVGHAHVALGRIADAIKDYQNVLAMAPDHALAHYNLGMSYLSLGQLDAAESNLTRSLQLDPDDRLARLGLGRLYLARKSYKQARDIFASFLGTESLMREARFYFGLAYLAEGKAREALHHLERSSQEGPFFSDSFHAMGNAYRVLGERDKAEKCYSRALEINANNVPAANALKEMRPQ